MAAEDQAVSADAERSSAARRADSRWRHRDSARAEVAEEAPAASEHAEPTSTEADGQRRARPRTAKARSGTKEFIVTNARMLAAVILLVLGIVLVILGWYGTAYTNVFTEQIPYLISGGLLGAALIIVAGFLASSASLERENRELRRDLVRAIAAIGNARPSMAQAFDYESPSDDGNVYAVSGGHSFHTAGCPIVEGKQARSMTVGEAAKAGLVPCKLCGPE